MGRSTKDAKLIISLLEVSSKHTCTYNQVRNNFDSKERTDEAISEAQNKTWIAKISKNKYKLTKIGQHQIQKKTKPHTKGFEFKLGPIRYTYCSACNASIRVGEEVCSMCGVKQRTSKKKKK